MIVALLNQKGGVGKTTLAVHLVTGLALRGRRTLLVDADPQGSALDWAASRAASGSPLGPEAVQVPVIGLPTKTLHREIQAHVGHFDDIVIDGPPRVNELARAAILAADVVLIPVQPSPYDVWAAKEIVDMLGEASVFKETQKIAFIINRKIVNTAIGRDVVDALAGYEVPVLATAVCQRVMSSGKKVTFGTQPPAKPTVTPEQWVESRTDEPTKRLTIDLPESLHRRVKMGCAERGEKMAEVIRELLQKEFPAE